MELGLKMELKNLSIFFSSHFLQHYDSTSSFADRRNYTRCSEDVTAAGKEKSYFSMKNNNFKSKQNPSVMLLKRIPVILICQRQH